MTLAVSGIQISRLRDAGLRSRISSVLSAALEPVQVKPVAAEVTFFDDNGPKRGTGDAVRAHGLRGRGVLRADY